MDIALYKTVREWRNQLHTIFEDVVGLHHSRHLYQDVRAIYAQNPALHTDHVFIGWLTKNYAESMAVGIRRQADRSTDAISTANLLADLAANADKLTWDWFVSEYLRRAPANDITFWKRNANLDFDHFAPEAAAQASAALIRQDADALQSIANSVRVFVNKRLAHHSTRGNFESVSLDDLHRALDQLGELLKRYHLLLDQAGLHGPEPMIQSDWKSVFRVLWIVPESGT